MTVEQIRVLRWWVRVVLAVGVIASTVANVLHAQPHPISQTIAAWPPVALLLTIELISRVPVHRPALAALRMASAAGIAGIASWVSYWHMVGVIARYGETGASPYLIPLTVDGLVIAASVSLVELAGRLRAATGDPVRVPHEPAPVDADPAPDSEPEPTDVLLVDEKERARRAYLASIDERAPLSGAELGRMFNRSERWGLARVHEVTGKSPGRQLELIGS